MAVIPAFLGLLCIAGHGIVRGFWMLVFFGSICADVGIVLYGAYAFGTLYKGAKAMAKGIISERKRRPKSFADLFFAEKTSKTIWNANIIA